MTEHTDRRTVLAGIGAVGATVGLSGCFGILGGSSTRELEYGDGIDGEITEDSPRDPIYDDLAEPYTFEGGDGDDVDIAMNSQDFDTYLVLTDENDEFVAEDDDGGPGLNSLLDIELDEDIVYTIWAGSFSGEATGDYELDLEAN